MYHDHHPTSIQERFAKHPGHSYLRDWVYGGLDGAVTTFALIAGVIGASLSHKVILLLGLTNIVADGFSMAAASFLATKAERDEYKFYESIEHQHIRDVPHGEQNEVRQLFVNKGFTGETLENIVNHVTADKQLWVRTMLMEEYGLPHAIRSPMMAAGCTFLAFFICGAIPLLPFVLLLPHSFLFASIVTAAVFFAIGSAKSKWSVIAWWKSGALTLLVGITAALLGYGIGALFQLHT